MFWDEHPLENRQPIHISKSNTAGVTSGTGTVYPSFNEFTSGYRGVRIVIL